MNQSQPAPMAQQRQPRDQALVILADDDATVRMLVGECLQAAGFDVITAKNGTEAVELTLSYWPDAVILDVMMPELDGYETCRQIRKRHSDRTLPILMMTSLGDNASIRAAYTAGVTEFTIKPVNGSVEAYRLRNMMKAARAVREVSLAKQEWERTFDAMDESVVIQTATFDVLQANRAAHQLVETITGEALPCRSAQTCEFFKSPVPEIRRAVESAFSSGTKQIFEHQFGEEPEIYQITVIPVSDEEQCVVHVVLMIKNITQKRKLETEIQQVQKLEAVGTLAGGLAHDFNNLLQAISGFSELASMRVKDDSLLVGYLSEIRDASLRGYQITRQLLTLGKRTSSQMEYIRLNDIIQKSIQLLGRTIPKIIHIDCRLASDLAPVFADGAQLDQILMNLGVNARDAMPEGGTLTFASENTVLTRTECRELPDLVPGEYVKLTVSDTGCGMDEETLKRIYEPFFTYNKANGTGLGLAMAYSIILQHNGYMACQSQPGVGTVFSIYLPVYSDDEVPAEECESEETDCSGSETVLLVDDVSSICVVTSAMLSNEGYRVLTAPDGQEALAVYEAFSDEIDLVILDINMPVMDGWECYDHLREKSPDIPVILASGFTPNQKRADSLDGPAAFICKPFKSHKLMNVIRNLLDEK